MGASEALGRAARPSNSSTSSSTGSLIVSSTHRSSPDSACSMAWGSSPLSRLWVMVGLPRHSVDNREIVVETLGADLAADSGVAELEAAATLGAAAWPSLASSSVVRPFSASGAGSRPFLMKRSASEAKHLRAPSATAVSSYLWGGGLEMAV